MRITDQMGGIALEQASTLAWTGLLSGVLALYAKSPDEWLEVAFYLSVGMVAFITGGLVFYWWKGEFTFRNGFVEKKRKRKRQHKPVLPYLESLGK